MGIDRASDKQKNSIAPPPKKEFPTGKVLLAAFVGLVGLAAIASGVLSLHDVSLGKLHFGDLRTGIAIAILTGGSVVTLATGVSGLYILIRKPVVAVVPQKPEAQSKKPTKEDGKPPEPVATVTVVLKTEESTSDLNAEITRPITDRIFLPKAIVDAPVEENLPGFESVDLGPPSQAPAFVSPTIPEDPIFPTREETYSDEEVMNMHREVNQYHVYYNSDLELVILHKNTPNTHVTYKFQPSGGNYFLKNVSDHGYHQDAIITFKDICSELHAKHAIRLPLIAVS